MVKGFLMVFAVLGLIMATTISTYAYSEDGNGNLVSDNILKINDTSYTSYGVNFVCSDNKITLNGTADRTGPVWFTINIPSGTYTLQDFNDFTYNDGFRITIRQGYSNDKVSMYYDTTNTYATFTSDVAMDILSITIVEGVNYNNVTLTPTLTKGSIPLKSYEPYGATYYKDRYITDASVMDYTNIAKAYINHHSGNYDNASNAQTGFIYQGQYGFVYSSGSSLIWDDFETDLIISGHDIKYYINSNYGCFYHTPWSMWQLITWNGTYPLRYVESDTLPISLTYEFITPINLNNVGFDMAEFDYITFYDFRGNMLGRVSKNDNVTVTYSNVSKIVGERHISDIPEDILYIASSLSSGYYDLGYKAGYNNGYNQGTQDGKENALDIGYQEGYRDGKIDGHDEGYKEALGEDVTTRGFWGLLNSIMSYPVNMIKSVFNFEFMGINISALITFIISIVIVVFVVHKFKK